MSVRWISSVWSDRSLKSKTELLLMLAIADYANEEGHAWPSIDTLAAKTRISQRQVNRIILALSIRRKLSVEVGSGPRNTNIYSILAGGVTPCHPDSSGTKNRTKKVPLLSPDPSGTVRNDQEPSVQSITQAVSIYESYPRKVGRPVAIRAISKCLKTTTAEDLLALTQAYAKAVALWPDDDKRFIPHPATWFNQERFKDDQATWIRDKVYGNGHNNSGVRENPLNRGIIKGPTDYEAAFRRKAGGSEQTPVAGSGAKDSSGPPTVGGA